MESSPINANGPTGTSPPNSSAIISAPMPFSFATPEFRRRLIIPALAIITGVVTLAAAALLAMPSRWITRRGAVAASPAGAAGAGAAGDEAGTAARLRPVSLVVVGVGGAYGAYFGGALGVVLLAVLSAFVGGGLRSLNATKTVLSLLVNTVALVAFVGFAPVDWTAVAVGAPASLVGGVAGGLASTRIDPRVLRWGIVAYATVAGLVMLVA